ncbi:hypothetical protein [truncated ORF], partial [Penicillium rubens Wisconsin 54-1255]
TTTTTTTTVASLTLYLYSRYRVYNILDLRDRKLDFIVFSNYNLYRSGVRFIGRKDVICVKQIKLRRGKSEIICDIFIIPLLSYYDTRSTGPRNPYRDYKDYSI